jgi:hypothetical protein
MRQQITYRGGKLFADLAGFRIVIESAGNTAEINL